jgi:hypothetical protein
MLKSAIRRISGEERYDDFITALQGYDPVLKAGVVDTSPVSLSMIRERLIRGRLGLSRV